MRIERRDIEAFTKKNCTFENGKIYLDDIEVEVFVKDESLCFICEELTSILKFYLSNKKHITIQNQTFIFSHPLCRFNRVHVREEEIEITFK